MAKVKVELPIGKKLVEIRPMTKAEFKSEGWEMWFNYKTCSVLVFEDGTKLYASSDEEGNKPGALFADCKGKKFTL